MAGDSVGVDAAVLEGAVDATGSDAGSEVDGGGTAVVDVGRVVVAPLADEVEVTVDGAVDVGAPSPFPPSPQAEAQIVSASTTHHHR